MKVNWNVIGGYCFGTISMCFYMEAWNYFPDNTHQGWACVVLLLFVVVVTTAFAMEKS